MKKKKIRYSCNLFKQTKKRSQGLEAWIEGISGGSKKICEYLSMYGINLSGYRMGKNNKRYTRRSIKSTRFNVYLFLLDII